LSLVVRLLKDSSKVEGWIKYAWFTCVLSCLAGCENSVSQRLLPSPVTLGPQPFKLTPTQPLRAPGRSTHLCVALPRGYREDFSSWSVHGPDGTEILISASLTTTEGTVHEFTSRSFMHGSSGHYYCLSSHTSVDLSTRYRQILICASSSFPADQISCIISYEM